MVMDVKATNHPISEEEKRLIRSGYYRKHDKYLDDETFSRLSQTQRNYYKTYEEPFSKKVKEGLYGLAGLGLIVGLWTSPIWIATGWDYLFGSDDTTTQSSVEAEDSNCNPNYSPCIPNSSYDLDCADVGKTVRVIGTDEYRLDRDGDGAGCESY